MKCLLPLLLCAACGGGPHLSSLRCRDAKACQGVENPLELLLAVDFDDSSGTLDKGTLNLRVDGQTQQQLSMAGLFAAQQIAAGTQKGSLQFANDMLLEQMTQGQKVHVSVKAVNGQGDDSNEPNLDFALHLGAP